MLTLPEVALFALTTFLLVLTPGPNMVYCVSRALPQAAPGKLFRMGFVTNVLNPKVALFYLSFAARMALVDPR